MQMCHGLRCPATTPPEPLKPAGGVPPAAIQQASCSAAPVRTAYNGPGRLGEPAHRTAGALAQAAAPHVAARTLAKYSIWSPRIARWPGIRGDVLSSTLPASSHCGIGQSDRKSVV